MVFLFVSLSGVSSAFAVEPDEMLEDPALEARARAISAQLRCVVCQNQDIDSSNAPLAKDLRILVRERLVAGDTDEEVFAFLTARYGDFILLKPPFNPTTWALWFAPIFFFGFGIAMAFNYFSGQRAVPAEAADELSAKEREELDRILKEDDTV